jgi:L-aminopeptidase/D-esterase-like protein
LLEFHFPEIHIGVAEYDEGPTGTTLFYFPKGVIAAADVRGGSPGTVNAEAVRLGYETAFIDAVVFSGGSWYGLAAATGAANAIKDRKREEGHYNHIAGVLGAIIYDVGWRRFSRITPDDELAEAALQSAVPNRFPLGARGAGRFAMQGWYYSRGDGADAYAGVAHSGQGAAFRQIGPTRIAVFTVVNSMGTIVDRQGRVVRCHRNNPDAECPPISELLASTIVEQSKQIESPDGPSGNTTLTLVVTNQKLPFADLQRLAVQVHTSMGRAIQPFATEDDGDVLYAVTTDGVENPDLSTTDLAVIASEVAWDAVLNSLPDLPAAPVVTDMPLDMHSIRRYVGTYEFPGGGRLLVTADAGSLDAMFSGGQNLYFDDGRHYSLEPVGPDLFLIDAPARDLLRFDSGAENATKLTINPGAWGLDALRAR